MNKFDPDKIDRSIRLALLGVRDQMGGDFEASVQTFRNRPTPITTPPMIEGGGLITTVGILDQRYFYVSRGTRIRWAVMSKDWQSKTAPNRLRAIRGSGQAIIIGKRAMLARGIPPRKGIEAREFDKQIAEKHRKSFAKTMSKAIKDGVR